MGESKPKDVYLLERGGLASARLMFQHDAVTRTQGWVLHPDIQAAASGQKSLRIADLATGNAIWAYDVAEQHPDAEVVGFDISDVQFPAQMTRPSNVRLELGDLFEPTPTKYQEYFDIVHIRLVVGAIYTMDKDILLKNILSMIKPGGFIQWDEIIEPTVLLVDPNLKVSNEPLNWIKRMYSVSNFRPATQWAADLPLTFEKYGLENVVGHKPPMKPSTLPLQTEALWWSFREIMNFAVKTGKPNAEEQLRLGNQDIEEQLAGGYMFAYAWIVAVGRKPC